MDANPKKKQFRLPLPTIRQTKTSMYRMIKANPLLSQPDKEPKMQTTQIGLANTKPLVTFASSKKNDIVAKSVPLARSLSVRVAKNTEKTSQIRRINSIRDTLSNLTATNKEKITATEKIQEAPPKDKPKVTFRTSTPTTGVTPRFGQYRATPFKVSPEETDTEDMCQYLNDWLVRNDKSPNEFYDLQNFGASSSVFDVENKENVEHFGIYKSNSYENLNIVSRQSLTPAHKNEYDLKKLACAALNNLHSLILEGYPFLQCEAWLEIIQEKYHIIDKEPEYWECRALIEQNKDNITAAVEHYRIAIIHGAEVNSVDRSLEELLQRFSLLNIGSEQKSNDNNKNRAKILSDARNIFKSSIIQAAIQERNLKKKEMLPDVLVTPLQSRTSIKRD